MTRTAYSLVTRNEALATESAAAFGPCRRYALTESPSPVGDGSQCITLLFINHSHASTVSDGCDARTNRLGPTSGMHPLQLEPSRSARNCTAAARGAAATARVTSSAAEPGAGPMASRGSVCSTKWRASCHSLQGDHMVCLIQVLDG